MNRFSIRLRITAIAVVAVGAALLAAGVALVELQKSQLTAGIDTALVQRADDITSLVANPDRFPDTLAGSRQEGFAQLLDASGTVRISTPNLSNEPPLPIDYEVDSAQVIQTIRGLDVDDDTFRVLSRTIPTPSGMAVLHVGTTFDVVAESVANLTATLSVAFPILVAVVGVLVWWLVGRTLAPVEAIRSEVAAIDATDLRRRLSTPQQMDEIGRLAETMNQMLARVETSVVRQQRFVSDASHELRTPLTRLRTEIEVEMATVDIQKRHILASLLEEVVALQRLVEDLLQLSGLEEGEGVQSRDLVDLDDIVLREVAAMNVDGTVSVDASAVSAAEVLGNRGQLTRMVRNLCDNAQRHARDKVTLALAEADGYAVLTVKDDGPGIPPEDVDIVFARFGRVDKSRTRDTGGTGLGLAIVSEIVEAHDGTIELKTGQHPGAEFVVKIPLHR